MCLCELDGAEGVHRRAWGPEHLRHEPILPQATSERLNDGHSAPYPSRPGGNQRGAARLPDGSAWVKSLAALSPAQRLMGRLSRPERRSTPDVLPGSKPKAHDRVRNPLMGQPEWNLKCTWSAREAGYASVTSL